MFGRALEYLLVGKVTGGAGVNESVVVFVSQFLYLDLKNKTVGGFRAKDGGWNK